MLSKLGVIGAGAMGSGIAQLAAVSGTDGFQYLIFIYYRNGGQIKKTRAIYGHSLFQSGPGNEIGGGSACYPKR